MKPVTALRSLVRISTSTRYKYGLLVLIATLLALGKCGFRAPFPFPPLSRPDEPENAAFCTSSKYTKGYWQRATCGISKNLGIGMDYTTRRGEACRAGKSDGRPKPCQASTCDWIIPDDGCKLLPFTRPRFCRALAGRSILFVGDSLTASQFRSLVSLTSPGGYKPGKTVRICNNRSSIAHVVNDVLATVPPDQWIPDPSVEDSDNGSSLLWRLPSGTSIRVGTQRSGPWVHLLGEYEILVMNTGVHLKVRDDDAFEEGLATTFRYLQEGYGGQVYYRLTSRGHPRCKDAAKSPIASYSDYLVSHPDDNPWYEWARVPSINAIERRLMAKFGIPILDVVAMTEMRPDTHMMGAKNDCLHYDLPSVVDSWNWLLFNAIAGLIN